MSAIRRDGADVAAGYRETPDEATMADRKVAFLGVRGSKRFPRFVITEVGGAVWTGEGWSGDPVRALLFADAVEASRAAQGVMRRQFAGLSSVQTFTVPIHVEVRSERGVDAHPLREWLREAATFTIGYGTCGSGPLDDSLALAHIDWLGLKAVSEEP